MPFTVLIADGDSFFRLGCREMFCDLDESIVILEASTIAEAESVVRAHVGMLDAVLVEGTFLEKADGVSVVRFAREQGLKGPIVGASSSDKVNDLMMKAGASHKVPSSRCDHASKFEGPFVLFAALQGRTPLAEAVEHVV